MIDQPTIDRILDAANIVDVVSEFVTLRKRGINYVGLCPFHSDKSPSFYVSPSKNICKCFACGEGGTAVHFIMKHEQLSYFDALRFLAKKYNIEIQERELTEKEKQIRSDRESMLIVNSWAGQYFSTLLHEHVEGKSVGMRYFAERGLREDIIRKFQLGYSLDQRDALYKTAIKAGYKKEFLEKTGLVIAYDNGNVNDRFRGRVIFPVHTLSGKVVAFGGRVLKKDEKTAKYVNSPESEIYHKSNELYGIYFAKQAIMKQDRCFLVEGYMDVISLHQSGFTNAVASLGTALTAGHAALIKRYVQEVYLTYDSDEAGTRAALRAVPILREAGISAKVVRMDPYKDPDEFIKNLGAEEYEKRIHAARNGFMFSLEMLEKQYDMNSPEGKTDFFKEVSRRLLEFEDELERNNYIEAVATAYRVSRESLEKMVAKMAVNAGMARPVARPKRAEGSEKKQKEDGILTSQKALLTWMIDDDRLFDQISQYISPGDFTESLYRTVAELLYEQRKQGALNPAKILNHFTEEEDHREAASLFNTRIKELRTKEEREQALQETILRVKSYSIEHQTMNLDPTDMRGLQHLMEEKRKLENLKNLNITIQ